MAEGSEEREREAAEGSKRKQRADWFGQTLGADWVEIEPGIYRQQSPAAEDAETPLDQELLDAIPAAEHDAEPEAEDSPTKERPHRRWLHR